MLQRKHEATVVLNYGERLMQTAVGIIKEGREECSVTKYEQTATIQLMIRMQQKLNQLRFWNLLATLTLSAREMQ